jgi:deferrochelatase/peroxidase EfeB
MQSLTTIVAPAREDRLPAIDALIDALGNPARPEIRRRIEATEGAEDGIHFMSLHAIPAGDGTKAHIILEFTADGAEEPAIDRIVEAIETELAPVFDKATDRGTGSLGAYLRAHRISIGQGLLANPGLAFAGTPGMTVGRIRREARLADFVADLVDDAAPGSLPLDRLASIRQQVAAEPDHAWALEPPPPPLREGRELGVAGRIAGLAGPFLRTYLWPAGLVLLLAFLLALAAGAGLGGAIRATLSTLLMLALALVALAVAGYVGLRRQEERDWVDERMASAATLREIGLRENFCAQNHMISVTRRKPGPIRWLTLRLAFWVVGTLAAREFRPGFLGTISTIHAARWITVPGTRNLVFLSNYGGSWESYLEDFITLASEGLTGIWSNTIGFPRARNLFLAGATDGERFKRFARASMRPTRFWYSAYPDLTTAHIRGNADMRRGLAAALTNDEAKVWLSLFGSAPLPEAKLESREIQSIVFGGLGFMPEGSCLLFMLPEDERAARGFVGTLTENTAFGDGRKLQRDAILTVALGGRALRHLGLPDDCVAGFPAAFLEGMGSETRARILGDSGEDAPEHWEWGHRSPDIALLVYGETAEAVAALEARVAADAAAAGMAPAHRIPLKPAVKPAVEPFGFVDGISQPIIRGSFQSFRRNDPIHLVQPGEFVIGYPDDRGNFPPEPRLSALKDPENRLPVAARSRAFGNSIVEAPRSIARNGTYLVIRQLEQDPEAFWDYCTREAEALAGRLPPPYEVTPDFVGAKLVGRWKDGSSLVRNPYAPFVGEQTERAARRARRATLAGYDERSAILASGQRLGSETVRPETRPEDQQPISPPSQASGSGDNDFLYGVEDPRGVRCPLGAHIRRANPRESFVPGSAEQIAISNRHRILRVGRLYAEGEGRKPGLLFMCLNGDIERQFEFIQQTWLVSPSFHGLAGEQDPLTSNDSVRSSGYRVPTHEGPIRLKPLPQFVRTLGGGYFFLPSRSFLAFLGRPLERPGAEDAMVVTAGEEPAAPAARPRGRSPRTVVPVSATSPARTT